MSREHPTCVYCQARPGVDEHGACAPCGWSFKAAVITGLAELGAYLAHHAAFSEWCASHGVAA